MAKKINWESWGEVVRMQQQAQVQEMMEVMRIRSMRSDFVNALQYGLLGLDFVSPFARDYDDYSESDDYFEDEYDFVDRNDTTGGGQRLTGHRPLVPHPCIKELSTEEKEKHAKKLLKQEEKLKEKAERKRLKRVRRKEKKRIEKDSSDRDSKLPDDMEQGLSTSSGNQKENTEMNNIEETTERCVEPGPIETETEVLSREETDSSKDTGEDEKAGEEGAVAREPEEFDMSSCFVATAATIVQRQFNQNPRPVKSKKNTKKLKHKTPATPRPEKPKMSEQLPVDEPKQSFQEKVEVEADDVITRSTELANIGNQYAARGQLDVAVKYFTDAIKHNPKEYKLFGNRSFCYERMKLYEQALGDADLALSMSPGWVKGLFRRGKALCGLKRYYEASLTYQEVMSLEPSRADGSQELMRVQILQLMEMGFTQEQSSAALKAHGTFEEAVDALSGVEAAPDGGDLQDQAAEEEWVVHQRSHAPARSLPRAPPSAPGPSRPRPSLTLPANAGKPELFPVWVGSLVPAITEATLHSLFSRAGEVYSIKMLKELQCAFVHYTQKEDCENAIELIHGFQLEGTSLAVRHPNKLHPHLGVSLSAETDPPLAVHPPPSVKKNLGDECYFWRTTGCMKKKCPYTHVPQHRGMDRDASKVKPPRQ